MALCSHLLFLYSDHLDAAFHRAAIRDLCRVAGEVRIFPLLALGGRVATRTPQRAVNTVTTNVPGPQHPMYLVGRRMLEYFPFVPLAGHVRICVAIVSYDGTLNFGVTGDYETAPDIGVLCEGIEAGLAELLKLSRPPDRPRARRARKPSAKTASG